MALTSPGVEVTVIDESFYTPAEPGTTPLIVVATAQDKTNAAGTGTAAATTKANAGVAYRLTSQKDLVDLFGVPFFESTASGSPVHGGERNEYGLLAAYSLLGVSNSVFMTRADINLAELEAQANEPGAEPNDGQWWVDTTATAWGIQEWNGGAVSDAGGQKFSTKIPFVLTNADTLKVEGNQPRESFGNNDDYAVVFETGTAAKESAKLFYKSEGVWVLVGSNDWYASHPTVKGDTAVTSAISVDLVINNTPVSGSYTAAGLAGAINSLNILGVTAAAVNNRVYLYSNGRALGGAANDGDSDSSLISNNQIVLENGPTVGGTGVNQVFGWSVFGIATGTYNGVQFQHSPHTQVPTWKTNQDAAPTGSVWIKTTVPNGGADWIVKKWVSGTQTWQSYSAPLYATTDAALYGLDRAAGGLNLSVDSIFVQYNSTEDVGLDTGGQDLDPATAQFRVWRRKNSGATVVVSDAITLTGANGIVNSTNYSFELSQSVPGMSGMVSAVVPDGQTDAIEFTGQATALLTAQEIVAKINAATFGFDSSTPPNAIPSYVSAEVVQVGNDYKIQISHTAGGDIRLLDQVATPIAKLFASVSTGDIANMYLLSGGHATGADDQFLFSNWAPLSDEGFLAQADAPDNEPQDGQLWYNPNFAEVDLMVHNGSTWVGFNNHDDYTDAEIIVSASEPELTTDQKDIDKHIWISTANLENFPTMYRWSVDFKTWNLIDVADQTTEEGVLFADARWGTSGLTGATADLITAYRTSNFLDPDAPDPALYPSGMILWNLRRSGGNVKRYANSYIDVNERNPRFDATNSPAGDTFVLGELMSNYETDRWVTASANNEDGSGSFGRKAQRKVVVAALKSVVDANDQIRDTERRNFNIIAAPGYPELLSNLINLNIDRGLTAFVIGDTPLRLPSDATSLVNWGTNAALVTDNGDDGIVSYDEYCAVYYPNGFTTDLSGNNAVVPASHMMMRTIALSDQVSYPWFAPAGTRRGGITNATSVGYIDALTGEFQTVALNEGTRDVLYDLKVNPIPFFVGSGLVAWGQKTRARNASALDRINVARLIVYLRSQLNKLARPYIFEPNDKITRDEVKGAVESLLLELVGLRAIYDFAVVCDESNNTPSRIDRNELWVDIAIEPVKAIEFIYIPLRVKNTGEI
jgi:hypothetical protein